MVDGIKVEDILNTYYDVPPRKHFIMFDLDFYPYYNREGKYLGHQSTFNGLLIKIRAGKMTIENSLHKFYHDNNYCDFFHSELIKSIELIEKKFGIPSNYLKIKKIEFGINVIDTEKVYSQFESYIMNDFDLMRKNKTVYGKKCYITEYNIKFYNKSIETKINPNNDISVINSVPKDIIRFEVQYGKMRPIKNEIMFLSDLKNRNTLGVILKRILNYLTKIIIDKKYNFDLLTPRELELFFAGLNNEFWLSQTNKETKKKKRKTFNRLVKLLNKNLDKDKYDDFFENLKNKGFYIINN